MHHSPLRWGILGTAQIAQKNWRAISLSGNGIVAAVASRSPHRSRHFVEACQHEHPFAETPRAYDTYEAMVEDESLDALYIPLPTGLRSQWVLRAVEAGKHVLCEKPCAASLEALQRVDEACRDRNVQFMDGVMFMHSRRLAALREALKDPNRLGEIRRITSHFSFMGSESFRKENIRMDSELEPYGCLGDLGWYCLRFALWVMEGASPVRVSGRILAEGRRPESHGSVPTAFAGELEFAEGVSAGFYCAFDTALEQWTYVAGTNGSLRMADFVLPFEGDTLEIESHVANYDVQGCDFRMRPDTRRLSVAEASHGGEAAQEVNMFREMGRLVREGRRDPAWMRWALLTQDVMERCRAAAQQRS